MFEANFSVSPLSGYAFGTQFVTTNTSIGTNIQQYIWNFGDTDENIYGTANPKYTYKYPGNFNITLSAIDLLGNVSIAKQLVSIDIAYRDYVKFIQIPEKISNPNEPTEVPFKIEVISSNPNKPIIIDLFSTNSKSTPYQFIPEKWNFLTPVWKFTDKNYNFITSLSVEPTPLYINNTVVGVSGTAEFYYFDSLGSDNPSSSCPLLITATLQTSSFTNYLDSNVYSYESHSNNETVRAGVIWQVNKPLPTNLKVTSNYIDNISTLQWKGIKIPTIVTCHSNRSLLIPGSENKISDILFSYPSTNEAGNLYPLNITLSGIDVNDVEIEEAPLYFQTTNNNFKTGGYIFTTLNSLTTAENTTIIAQTTGANTNYSLVTDGFVYPEGVSPNTSVWVSNPNQGTLNKITLVPYSDNCNTINFFKEKGILTDGIIKEVAVPKVTDNTTFNYSVCGFAGIYGMAIDPRNYDLIASDAELDKMYRISNTGQILNQYDFRSLNDYDPFNKMFSTWSFTTPTGPTIGATYNFYNPTFLSSDSKNYIVQVGGLVQPTNTYTINSFTRTLTLPIIPDPVPGNVNINVTQIFNPSLTAYANSLSYWLTSSPNTESTFYLDGSSNLVSDPNYYFVAVEGLVQNSYTYTIDISARTITFTEPISSNYTVQVLYIPTLTTPTTWVTTINTENTTSITLTSVPGYVLDETSSFIINFGGILQSDIIQSYDFFERQITFKTPLPVGIPISITQLSIPETLYQPAAYTPSYISLDKNYDIWTSLVNTVSVLKFNQNFNLLFSVAPSGFPFSEIQFDGDYLLRPPVVETDRQNNCWATYAHPLCSILTKYSETGNLLVQIELPLYSIPVNLTINSKNNVWVGNYHNSSYTTTPFAGNLQLYDGNTYTLLTTVTGIDRPGYVTIDRNDNLWFTSGIRNLGYYNTNTQELSYWSITKENINLITTITQETTSVSNLEQDEEIGGLCVDIYNRVWVIDSLNNNTWVLSATSNNQLIQRKFKIIPNTTLGFYQDNNTQTTYTEFKENYNYKSAQATGDWSGNRWYQKYIQPEQLSAIQLFGMSNNFTIQNFENKYQFKKINESFDNAAYFKSLALPENLKSNTVLFDDFLATAVGTGEGITNNDLGQIIYERISNYITNHSDIDTCNIDQLASIAKLTDVPVLNYATLFPADILRMLNLGSVSRSKLFGVENNVPLLPQSLGNRLNTQTDFLTAGTNIYLKSKLDNSINLISVPIQDDLIVYPLSSFYGYGFSQPVTINYIFYDYSPVYNKTYIENIIDWDATETTLSSTLSTYNEWYGDNGVLESIFRYLLTKNLFLK
jgi:hypothetical protein